MNTLTMEYYREVVIESTEDFLNLLSQTSITPNLIYRGQSDFKWPLLTSIQRKIGGEKYKSFLSKPLMDIQMPEKINYESVLEHEREILFEFKRRYFNYANEQIIERNVADWLALIQHYGGPTRLLDFTRSLGIAAFFAIEDNVKVGFGEKDAAIWAINYGKLINTINYKIEHVLEEDYDKSNVFNLRFIEDSLRFQPFVISPFLTHLNKRMIAQQGLFIVPMNLASTIEDNLLNTFISDKIEQRDIKECDVFYSNNIDKCYYEKILTKTCIVKIKMPKYLHYHILKILLKLGISYSNLYPDLEGLARSMAHIGYFD